MLAKVTSLLLYNNKANVCENRSKRSQGEAIFALLPCRLIAWFSCSPCNRIHKKHVSQEEFWQRVSALLLFCPEVERWTK